MARPFVAALVTSALTLGAGSANAETCPIGPGADPSLAAVSADVRLEFLKSELGAQARYAALWQTSWMVVRTAILAEQVGLAMIASSPGDREAATITSVFAALPPIGTVLFGLRVAHDGPAFLRMDGAEPNLPRCALIARGEELFARSAKNEDDNRGWLQHVLQLGGSAALFAILGFGYGHWRDAIVNGVAGIALGELQILTQPTGLVGGWQRYQNGMKSAPVALVVSPAVGPSGIGLTVGARF